MNKNQIDQKNTGKVLEIKDGIIFADGLEDVGASEIVEIYTADFKKILGIALELDDKVGIVAIGEYEAIRQGDTVMTTGKLPSIKVNKNYLGRVIDALGNPIDGKGDIDLIDSKEMILDRVAPGVIERKDVERPLQTGIMAIDAMIPIGRGQRQLIIGDRLTGKTTIAIDTMINQKDKNCVSIYVAIGQKVSKVSALIKKLEEKNALKNSIIVLAPISSLAAMQYLAPFTGTAIGEYFAELGEDALVIYDDLIKHAQAYREISLLLRRPSGRDAYPGDIFYLHSRILERSIQYNDKLKGGSLTALPIIETQAGDLSAYVPTNVISITDGQIFLEQGLFNAGQKPAISVGLSVSRVGGAAQSKGMKQVSGQIKMDLAQYRELATFAQFGSDLDTATQKRLDQGAKIMEALKQDQYSPRRVDQMIAIMFAISKGLLNQISKDKIRDWIIEFEKEILNTEFIKELDGANKIEGEVETKLREYVEEFSKKYEETRG